MSGLSRASSDLIEWSTLEFGYVELADEYASSSSIMPQKKNPSTLELIRGKTGEVYGALMELLTMVKGVTSGYSQDLQGTKPPLWRCFDTIKTCLEVMTGVVSTIKVKEERMRGMAEGSLTVAVDLAERLVETAGLSFREAYRLVAALVKATSEKGMRLQELEPAALAETSTMILGKRVEVDKEFIRDATSSQSSLKRRKSLGSPQPREVRRMLTKRKRKLEEHKDMLDGRRDAVEASKGLLREAVENYLSK